MSYRITLIPGDGIGPEVTAAAVGVLEAAGVPIAWDSVVAGEGLVPGANLGDGIAVFEAVHGGAPDIAGKDLANSTTVILSGVEVLNYLGEHEKAQAVYRAVCGALAEGKTLTRDLGGQAGTREMARAVIEMLH